eukprot:6191585-Pleurochrysis_carterae.AAC.2
MIEGTSDAGDQQKTSPCSSLPSPAWQYVPSIGVHARPEHPQPCRTARSKHWQAFTLAPLACTAKESARARRMAASSSAKYFSKLSQLSICSTSFFCASPKKAKWVDRSRCIEQETHSKSKLRGSRANSMADASVSTQRLCHELLPTGAKSLLPSAFVSKQRCSDVENLLQNATARVHPHDSKVNSALKWADFKSVLYSERDPEHILLDVRLSAACMGMLAHLLRSGGVFGGAFDPRCELLARLLQHERGGERDVGRAEQRLLRRAEGERRILKQLLAREALAHQLVQLAK